MRPPSFFLQAKMRAVNRRALNGFLLSLALVAAGLLSIAPSIFRFLAAQDHGGWTELCSGSGLKWVHLASGDIASTPDVPHRHDGADCDYCLLLGHANTPPPMLAATPLLPTRQAPLPIASTRHRVEHEHPTGLGSRGPPRPALTA
jgi:hypothetical protein